MSEEKPKLSPEQDTPEHDKWVIGLMSGTSLDGVDAALMKTDGQIIYEVGPALTENYSTKFRQDLTKALKIAQLAKGKSDDPFIKEVERALTDFHRDAVLNLIKKANLTPADVRLAGFHGQTLFHDPANGLTWQIGDGQRLAKETGIPVINDFRSNDVVNGGEGAPLVPIYHWAMMANHAEKNNCIAVLNIGGVGNVTWMDLGKNEPDILGFDTGPGNAPIDDIVFKMTGEPCDWNGDLAAKGKAFPPLVTRFLADPYFSRPPPKSLDRNEFNDYLVFDDLNVEDAAATATSFVIESVKLATEHFPKPAKHWYICGGGAHNKTLMAGLKDALGVPVSDMKELGFEGDFIEAEAFAFLAACSEKGLPITFPTTTNAKAATTGGTLWQP